MNEEMYKKLNSYLNDFFVEAQKYDPIFIDEIDNFCKLSEIIMNEFNGIHKKEKSQENNLSFNDVYLIAREIISSIDTKYLSKYDQILQNGILDFSYEKEYFDSHYSYIHDYNNNQGFNEININRSFDYTDITTLVHEFFHYTNGDCILSHNRIFLTEFISIYYEEYAKKYLIKEKKLASKDVLINDRIIYFLVTNKKFNSFCLLLLAYEKLGNLSSNTPNEMKEIFSIEDITFEVECLNLVEKIDSSNDGLDFYSYLTRQYKYLVGTILAYYALEHCDIKDIIKLNDSLNDPRYVDKNIYELLERYGIEFDDNLIYKSIDNMKKVLNCDNLKK